MIAKKKTIKREEVKEEAVKAERYFYAVGRRKTSIAKVKLFSVSDETELTINGRKFNEYFSMSRIIESTKEPLAAAGEGSRFKVIVKVSGGGISAQADAVKLGIARALVLYDETLKKSLKDKGYLTRDSRMVERKKPGLKKARRAPQWAKR